MSDIIYLLLFLGVWIGTMVYAYRKHRERFWTFFILCLLGGPLGFLLGLLIINAPSKEQLDGEKEDVETCPDCGWLYKPAEYREDATIVCKGCNSELREALST